MTGKGKLIRRPGLLFPLLARKQPKQLQSITRRTLREVLTRPEPHWQGRPKEGKRIRAKPTDPQNLKPNGMPRAQSQPIGQATHPKRDQGASKQDQNSCASTGFYRAISRLANLAIAEGKPKADSLALVKQGFARFANEQKQRSLGQEEGNREMSAFVNKGGEGAKEI